MRLATALALLVLAACSKPTPTSNAPAAANVVPPQRVQPPKAVAPEPRLARIFTPDILGADLGWLEANVTGPAFDTHGADRTYKVGVCEVIVGVRAGKIANIGVTNYGPACSFKIAQYFGSGSGPTVPDVPMFGDIKTILGGDYDADCLKLCGNAADPVVSLIYHGSHADNFNDLVAQISVTDDATAAAWQDWSDKLAFKHGGAYVETGKYHQGDSLQDVAAADFASLRPTTIRVGQDLPGA